MGWWKRGQVLGACGRVATFLPNLSVKSAVGGALLALATACQSGGEQSSNMTSSLTSNDGSTGVTECDTFLDQYEQCMQSTLPASQFTQQQAGIKRQRLAWKTLADSVVKRQALASVCLGALRTAREEFGSCTFGVPRCGNGRVEAGEACDDGNTADGDGCSASCSIEPRCGNGRVEPPEQCDDGNTTSGDGCSASCVNEPRCTDGVQNGSETDVDCGGSCSAKCASGKHCGVTTDCQSGATCSGGVCTTGAACAEASALDLGAPATVKLVASNACLRVRDGYPSWWGTARTMQLQTQQGGAYPLPFVWSSSCKAASGSDSFTADFQSKLLSPTSSGCATLIKLNGSGASNVRLAYYGQ